MASPIEIQLTVRLSDRQLTVVSKSTGDEVKDKNEQNDK